MTKYVFTTAGFVVGKGIVSASLGMLLSMDCIAMMKMDPYINVDKAMNV